MFTGFIEQKWLLSKEETKTTATAFGSLATGPCAGDQDLSMVTVSLVTSKDSPESFGKAIRHIVGLQKRYKKATSVSCMKINTLKLMKLLVYDLHHKMTSPCFLLLQPGRVATLIEDHEAVTYGVAFQLINEAALDYLNNREVALGGYISHITMLIPQDPTRMPMPVLLYVATPSNQHWLGHASSEHIANQVRLL